MKIPSNVQEKSMNLFSWSWILQLSISWPCMVQGHKFSMNYKDLCFTQPMKKVHGHLRVGHLRVRVGWVDVVGAIHSTKIPTGPTGKRGPPQKVDPFFRNFSVGPNRSIEFWTEISGKFGWMDCAQYWFSWQVSRATPFWIFCIHPWRTSYCKRFENCKYNVLGVFWKYSATLAVQDI